MVQCLCSNNDATDVDVAYFKVAAKLCLAVYVQVYIRKMSLDRSEQLLEEVKYFI